MNIVLESYDYMNLKERTYKLRIGWEEMQLGRELMRKYGDTFITDLPLSEDTPLADSLQDMQMLVFRLEQHKASEVKKDVA